MFNRREAALVLAMVLPLLLSTCSPAPPAEGMTKSRAMGYLSRCRGLEAQGRRAQARLAAGERPTAAQYVEYQVKLLWYNTHCR